MATLVRLLNTLLLEFVFVKTRSHQFILPNDNKIKKCKQTKSFHHPRSHSKRRKIFIHRESLVTISKSLLIQTHRKISININFYSSLCSDLTKGGALITSALKRTSHYKTVDLG